MGTRLPVGTCAPSHNCPRQFRVNEGENRIMDLWSVGVEESHPQQLAEPIAHPL